MDKVFQALSSAVRRRILAYLSKTDLSAGEIAERFDMTKPSISKHLDILENAGLVHSEKRGQYVIYGLERESLAATLHDFVASVCPESSKFKKESAALSRRKRGGSP